MAKGNALLGYSRGSVGDVTFSRVKGQQVSKARNRQPANPKTNKQVLQRASFINPVKFFTQGAQALFKFAYSDKKVTESDFNAFQRHNAKASFPVTKAEYDNPAFPPLGNYLMSKGKLAGISTVKHENFPNANFILFPGTVAPATIGALSQAFLNSGKVEVGDIVTLVGIRELVASASATSIVTISGVKPAWTLNQFIVDPSSSETVDDRLPDVAFEIIGSNVRMEMTGYDEDPDEVLHSIAVVVSRETALGLEVSTSYLQNGGHIDDYIAHRKTDAEVGKVLADWGATGDAILQGAIAKK